MATEAEWKARVCVEYTMPDYRQWGQSPTAVLKGLLVVHARMKMKHDVRAIEVQRDTEN